MFVLDENFYEIWVLAGEGGGHARCLASWDFQKDKIEIVEDRNKPNINIKN